MSNQQRLPVPEDRLFQPANFGLRAYRRPAPPLANRDQSSFATVVVITLLTIAAILAALGLVVDKMFFLFGGIVAFGALVIGFHAATGYRFAYPDYWWNAYGPRPHDHSHLNDPANPANPISPLYRHPWDR